MYDSHNVDLCNMCDSHGVYLRVLWTIYMDKFSRCHVIVFHDFFCSNDQFSGKFDRFLQKSSGNHQPDFREKSAISR
jgi:hypothetical protein